MNKKLITAGFISGMLLLFSATAAQKFYKWVDEDGQIHYSAEKPEDKKTAEVNIRTKKAVAQAVEVGSVHSQVSDPSSAEDEPEKSYLEQKRERQAKAQKLKEVKRKICMKAKYNVAKYQRQGRLSRMDPKTGEKVYLEDDQRKQLLAKAQQRVRKNC